MSVKRVEQIVAYGEAIIRCYETMLTVEERSALQAWEYSNKFTSTDLWRGWARHIGLSPCIEPSKPHLVRRGA